MTELAPLVLASVIGAALLVTYAVGLGFGFFRDIRAQPVYLLIALPMPVAALVGLILLDLLRFLMWIGRNPDTEKPDTHFIPRANRGASTGSGVESMIK
ncbi:MAG TPA: hypothetical protein VH253_13110 [Phycisphaerae bacterium]|nr:hypothetical protein [Phycisphaerae bacterium]